MAITSSDRGRLNAALHTYFDKVKLVYATGQAREHAYRPAQISLFDSFNDLLAVNDAAKSEAGFPDFLFLKASNTEITRGYGEGKDLGANLDKVEKSEQLLKYGTYDNLILTNVLEYRFYSSGNPGAKIILGRRLNGTVEINTSLFDAFIDEFAAFLEQPPEKIRSAKRLAEIMGGKARRIRFVADRLLIDNNKNDVGQVYAIVKKTLSHDMEPQEFSDMYAQTLVYGLFAARYHDPDLDTFSRQEARDLIAHETDFLKHFFDHIAGASLPADLLHIVNELCDVLRVSDVKSIVSAHLKGGEQNGRDPIIHFYELFLSEYDAEQRKDRGVYYTPTPVVRYIVKSVDRVLKEHFDIPTGIADAQKKKFRVSVNDGYSTDPQKKPAASVIQERHVHRVQILDPAVGTATFLNETIRYIHKSFEQQAGLWPSYVKDDLLPRIHGFELMMAPYSIAHIKLAMTLGELGVPEPGRPTGVYLTNTLDQATELDQDLFAAAGLSAAFSEEATRASLIKSETPIMVVMGNPPYSGHSENKSSHAKELVNRYKVEPGGVLKLNERNSKWLNDDYVKFIAFAEQMIEKNVDGGVLAMITNNGYLDNATFRGMRWHLTNTFDTIYIIDLHGSLKKKEKAPDGSKDENVFDIQQGVAIIIAVKKKKKNKKLEPAKVLHADLYGTRKEKFASLEADDLIFEPVDLDPDFYFLQPRDATGREEYRKGLPVDQVFRKGVMGLFTGRDKLTIDSDRDVLWRRVNDFIGLAPEDARNKYSLNKDVHDWRVRTAQEDVRKGHSDSRLIPITYRPFDVRWTYYTGVQRGFYYRPRLEVMKDLRDDPKNLALVVGRQGAATGSDEWSLAYVARNVIDLNIFSRGGGFVFPLRVRDAQGEWRDNVSEIALARFAETLSETPSSRVLFSYVYGILNSIQYRNSAHEFLKSAYPIIPMPLGDADFARHVTFGQRLQELHLLEAGDLGPLGTSFSIVGSNVVGRRRYDEGSQRLWINDEQFIGNVSRDVWEYRIGGYQVIDKWLKDRRSMKLSAAELRHVQVIMAALKASAELVTMFNFPNDAGAQS